MSVASFGAAGDGRTLNTQAFAAAVARIQRRRAPGGALLYVPPGVWLTGPFSLASHMTLFLARGAVIRATQVAHTPCPALLLSKVSLFCYKRGSESAQPHYSVPSRKKLFFFVRASDLVCVFQWNSVKKNNLLFYYGAPSFVVFYCG
jgi:hypothetical protein